ncbi:MAG: HNH endonuclease [Butyrivibrio sp.]|nr:HNH endonuclease [Acetatifactor muris]MCM1560950.1 HNH endonuclease [Butyrivibrio sp.]
MAKDWSKDFYNSAVWKTQRQAILKRDRFRCTEPGCHRTAEEVHHIEELTEANINNPQITLNPKNLRSLCSRCHKRITREMKQKSYGILEDIVFDADGYPVRAAAPPGGSIEKSRS